MTVEAPVSLAEQRRLLREQLGAQRQQLTRQLAGAGGTREGFPRSATVRWLMHEPELVNRFVRRVAGERVAAAMPAVLLIGRFLRSAIG